MARYRITVEYDGSDFVGWQRQDNGPSVQQVLEEALAAFQGQAAPEAGDGYAATVHGAGRTDAGVHAIGQAAHLDVDRELDSGAVRDGLNFYLKHHRVVVRDARRVADDFHARFDARERRYLYRILNRRPPPGLERGRVWWVPTPLDVDAMADAASVLVGHHDFTTFRASQCQAKSPVKTLDGLGVSSHGEEILVTARAKSFLHHQVRNMVGSLRLVGEGKWTADDLAAALQARDRTAGGPTAPASGLYLTEVLYDDPPVDVA
ncbi:MAG: tRNA pseudouridine(38-40) synthase TruA [Rhodobacterales bacterium]|nr:tRNA pseudouridine(38-40) synthase TruA [Rhodobacterales bacterium]